MRKHTYTEATAPTNTGSIERPARLNLRQSCSTHARTHAAFQAVREITGLSPDTSYADVWEKKILLAIEHLLWNIRNGTTATRDYLMTLFDPLPTEDYLRNQYHRLQLRFDPSFASREAV